MFLKVIWHVFKSKIQPTERFIGSNPAHMYGKETIDRLEMLASLSSGSFLFHKHVETIKNLRKSSFCIRTCYVLRKKYFRKKKQLKVLAISPGWTVTLGRIFVMTCFVRFCAYYCIVHVAQDTLTCFVCINI